LALQGVEVASNHDYDAILMGVNMPSMAGVGDIGATKVMRQLTHRQLALVPIIVLSADVGVTRVVSFIA